MATIPPNSVIPPVGFAPFQNYGNLVAYSNQQTQYFAQSQSNPPGQTADLVLRNLTSILNLLLITQQASDFQLLSNDLQILVTQTTIIIQANIDYIIDKFSKHPNWFSAILPNKGYASMSSTNSLFGQPNFAPLLQQYNVNQSGLQAQTLMRVVYSKLYAQNLDFTNADSQINRYTYQFIASAYVTAVDIYVPPNPPLPAVTQTVAQWFADLVGHWSMELISWTGSPIFWQGFIQPILDNSTTNAVIVEQFIPSDYIAYPALTSSISSNSYVSYQTYFYIYLFTLISILLAKQLRALSLSATKIASLKDDATNTLPFKAVSDAIKDASTYYLTAFNNFITTTNIFDYTTNTGHYLDFQSLVNINTAAALDPRNSSADPNRSPGSFQPTILYQKVLVNLLIFIDSNNYNGLFSTFVTNGQVPALTISYDAFIYALKTQVLPAIENAYNALAPREDIHYGQWPQNMSNI